MHGSFPLLCPKLSNLNTAATWPQPIRSSIASARQERGNIGSENRFQCTSGRGRIGCRDAARSQFARARRPAARARMPAARCGRKLTAKFGRRFTIRRMTLFARLVDASQRVGASAARLTKVRELAALLRTLPPEEIETAVLYLSGDTRQGRIGIGS